MTFDGFSEYIRQTPIILTALEALSAVIAILFRVTLSAFVIYLIGAWRLCRAEGRMIK